MRHADQAPEIEHFARQARRKQANRAGCAEPIHNVREGSRRAALEELLNCRAFLPM
jgi:hypothetical protein